MTRRFAKILMSIIVACCSVQATAAIDQARLRQELKIVKSVAANMEAQTRNKPFGQKEDFLKVLGDNLSQIVFRLDSLDVDFEDSHLSASSVLSEMIMDLRQQAYKMEDVYLALVRANEKTWPSFMQDFRSSAALLERLIQETLLKLETLDTGRSRAAGGFLIFENALILQFARGRSGITNEQLTATRDFLNQYKAAVYEVMVIGWSDRPYPATVAEAYPASENEYHLDMATRRIKETAALIASLAPAAVNTTTFNMSHRYGVLEDLLKTTDSILKKTYVTNVVTNEKIAEVVRNMRLFGGPSKVIVQVTKHPSTTTLAH